MDKINKLYDIIERDYGIVICDNRANNGCFPNYRVEMKIPSNNFSIDHPVFLYGWDNDEIIYSFRFYLNQKQIDELNSEEEEEEDGINE